jgi:hypothetical protein
LKDIVPSLDAILTHAIPVSRDPYGEARPFLKLWDIQLASIPWSSWKASFPPAEPVQAREPPAALTFPTPKQLGVPDKIRDIYATPYPPGISVRRWLMDRIDGGGLVMELLRSATSEAGLVNLVPTVDLPQAAYPDTTLEACSLEGKSFQDFVTTGILRRTITGASMSYQCVPLEFIKQERAQAGYRGRRAWPEGNGDILKKTYLRRLADVTPLPPPRAKEPVAPLTPARPESVRRAEVMAIQRDEERYPDDKLKAIRTLLAGTTLTAKVYTDPDGSFVLCSHALALLSGELAVNRQLFYDTWTARVNGFRVCKFCGEQLNTDVFEDADEYDEEGFLIRSAETLYTPGQQVSTGVVDYVSSLRLLQPFFTMTSPHDDVVFLILSLLQVIPSADSLRKFLGLGRAVATAQFHKGSAEEIARAQGAMGVATAALLLQCHIPTLVPRRSFGARPLMLSGYPRDSPTPIGEYTIAETLLGVLRKTFEAFPSTFTGPAKALLKGVVSTPGDVRRIVVGSLSLKSPLLFRKMPDGSRVPTFVPELLAAAKRHVAESPRVEAPATLIPVIPPPTEFGVITSFPTCPSARPVWTSGRIPSVSDPDSRLRRGLQAARGAIRIVPTVSDRAVPARVEKEVIRTRLMGEDTLKVSAQPPAKKAAPGKTADTDEKEVTVRIRIGDEVQTNLALASRLADLVRQPSQVRTVDPTQDSDELRDIARGLVVERLLSIRSAPRTATLVEERRTKDVALYMLQADYVSEKSQANQLRATERLTIVEDLKQKSDTERELMQQMLAIGIAPYLVTLTDRVIFARQAELLQDTRREEEDNAGYGEADDMPPLEPADSGVGGARDGDEDRDADVRGVGHGDYGDQAALPEGRDPPETSLGAGGGDRSV